MNAHRLTIRMDFATGARLGPGKIALLEAVAAEGSISGAGRKLKMSYKRAWDLVDELNKIFAAPLVSKAPGGARGGGAHLTEAGMAVVKHYREIERAAHAASESDLSAIATLLTV